VEHRPPGRRLGQGAGFPSPDRTSGVRLRRVGVDTHVAGVRSGTPGNRTALPARAVPVHECCGPLPPDWHPTLARLITTPFGTARLNALYGPRRERHCRRTHFGRASLTAGSSIRGSEPAPTVPAYSLELGAGPCRAGVARGVQEARAKPPATGADTMDTWLDNALRRSPPRS
jgi:hypothetical protein